MDIVFLIGRVLFGIVFVGSAIGHFTQTEYLAGYAASKGVPQAKLVTLVAGAVILIGAVSVALGIYGEIGAAMLFAFLVPTAFVMHAFWKETDAEAKMTEQIQFNKDLSLAGGALALVYIFSSSPALTLVGPLVTF